MVNQLKQEVIQEVEKLIARATNGYPVSFDKVIDKIWYIRYLSDL